MLSLRGAFKFDVIQKGKGGGGPDPTFHLSFQPKINCEINQEIGESGPLCSECHFSLTNEYENILN